MQDISTIINAEQKSNSDPKSSNASLAGPEDKSKDLSGVVEHILWKQHQKNDFYNKIQSTNIEECQSPHKKLMLNRVNDSDVAVFQSMQTENDRSSMKDEVN